MKGYPRFFSPLLWVILTSVFITGLFLAPGALEMRLEWEVPWRLAPGMRIWLAAGHALSAFAVLSTLGGLAAVHMRAGFRRRRNLTTGLLLLAGFVALALTALGIYYLGDERLGVWASIGHLAIGLLLALPLGLHVATARRLCAENQVSLALSAAAKARVSGSEEPAALLGRKAVLAFRRETPAQARARRSRA
jgi:hypothetical protein